MGTTIRFTPVDSDYEAVAMIDKITHITKNTTGDLTLIHLVNGTILAAKESINTIQARIYLTSDYHNKEKQ